MAEKIFSDDPESLWLSTAPAFQPKYGHLIVLRRWYESILEARTVFQVDTLYTCVSILLSWSLYALWRTPCISYWTWFQCLDPVD